jgi:hypothetical protein
MRTAPTVAILRPTGPIGRSCATAAWSWLDLSDLAQQARDEERCCERHCYERESELFKHVHLPWLLGSVSVWGGEVCDANHRSREFVGGR